MKKPVPKMCMTCRNYFSYEYYCTVRKLYIGYVHSAEYTKCKDYSLCDDYRRGGKFYNSREEKENVAKRSDESHGEG